MAEKNLVKKEAREKNVTMAVQYHLYEHPLYQCVEEEEKTIRVLLIGFDRYGQEFLDVCLQAGQMKDKFLNVTVIHNGEEEKEDYLQGRPELGTYFNIDDGLDNLLREGNLQPEDLYGTITFGTIKLTKDEDFVSEEFLRKIMAGKEDPARYPHYIFVTLGTERRNEVVTRACAAVAKEQQRNCLVSYVSEGIPVKKKRLGYAKCYPLYVNEDKTKDPLYEEIERMAFNSHLVWQTGLNIDYNAAKREFRKKYNHDSSVGNVLSLKYKLHSIGIDIEKCGFNEAARKFNAIVSSRKNEEIRNELIWVEHRRWVTEKLCQGWTTRPVKQCENGNTKDELRRQHVCIVRSRPDQKLAELTLADGIKKWDKISDKELALLDPLDCMSVKLHRFYVKRAKGVMGQGILSDSATNEIRLLLERNREALDAFLEWLSCMKDIRDGERERVFLYDSLKNTVEQYVSKLPASKRKLAELQIEELGQKFKPILESMKYQDWKQNDTNLVDHIPFILTFRDRIHMIIPYATGNKTAVFGNVAAPTVVNPEKIIYVYLVRKEKDLKDLHESIPGVIAYLTKKTIRSKVELVLIFEGISPSTTENLRIQEKIVEAGKGRIRKPIRCITASAGKDCWEELELYFKNKKSRTKNTFFVAERNSTKLSLLLGGEEFYTLFPHYMFDSVDRKFKAGVDCDLLYYIPSKAYITFSEMMALAGAYIKGGRRPEFYEKYTDLWIKYRNNRKLWKEFCAAMKKYFKKNDHLRFEQKGPVKTNAEIYNYFLPFECAEAARTILKALKEQSVAESESCVEGYTSESCRVIIYDKFDNHELYDSLFDKHWNTLMDPERVTVFEGKEKVSIELDNLEVEKADVLPQKEDGGTAEAIETTEEVAMAEPLEPSETENKEEQEAIELARYFAEIGFFADFEENDNKISFRFISRQIKEIFKNEGNMLEIYIYHKLKAMGDYDDIVNSCEIGRNKGVQELKNEFDCILTKGFCSWFIECKAQSRVNVNFYYKISALAQKFGINAKIILIAETEDKENKDSQTASINAVLRKRGEELGVITIWKESEIGNIGYTLRKIMEKN